MIKNLFLRTLCFLLGVLPGIASDFDQANQQFKSGNYAEAAASYEKILSKDGPSASVYYNLGNSYQQLKRYGPAILAYERARLLTPRDPDLLANLARARKAATAFEENGLHPWLAAVLHHFSRNEWSWLIAGGALFLGATMLAAGAVHLPRRWAITAAVTAVLAIATGSTAIYLRRAEADRGIVLSESATVRLSPFEKAESLGTPGQGRIVHLGAENDGYQYIEVPGANLHGWLSSKDVASIIPK